MNDLAVIDAQPIITTDQVAEQVQSIQDLMKRVMQQDQHYGCIPGCGDKPTLLQPGAQKIALAFGFAPEYTVERNDLPNAHREYEVTCRLLHRKSGNFVGEGVGVCSTMEGKYRFRSENTGRPVPQEYWHSRDNNLLGGPSYSPKKVDNKWVICHRVEHDNPADYYNTVKKMAKKRAYVDAVITATAAGDIFTQDLEDMPEVIGETARSDKPTKPETAIQQNRSKPTETKEPPTKTGESENDVYTITSVKLEKEGKGKKGPWKLFVIETAEGEIFRTFSQSDVNFAEQAVKDNFQVLIEYAENKYGKNIERMVKADEQASEDAPPLDEPIEMKLDARILSVTEREETSNGKPITAYVIETSWGRMGTYNEKIAADLKKLAGKDVPVCIQYREIKKGKLITKLEEIPF